jgi:hypothetical protein
VFQLNHIQRIDTLAQEEAKSNVKKVVAETIGVISKTTSKRINMSRRLEKHQKPQKKSNLKSQRNKKLHK